MYHARKYPESWVWLRPGCAIPGRIEDSPDSYPVIACVRTVAIALQIAERLGLSEPIIQTRMPYDRRLCKTQWWEAHPPATYYRRRR